MNVNPPDGRRFWITEDRLITKKNGQPKPGFPIAAVCTVFFGRTADWMRNIEALYPQVFYLDGVRLDTNRTEAGNRVYTLLDVERHAHALLAGGRITAERFTITINVIRCVALLYGILTVEEVFPPKRTTDTGKQLVIPTVDDQLVQAEPEPSAAEDLALWLGSCSFCQIKQHENCMAISEVRFQAPGETPNSSCPCFNADPVEHGVAL